MTWSPSDRPASSPPACLVLKPKVASQAEQTKLDTQFWLGKNAWGTWTLLCEQGWEGLGPLGDAKLDRAARFVNSHTPGPKKGPPCFRMMAMSMAMDHTRRII